MVAPMGLVGGFLRGCLQQAQPTPARGNDLMESIAGHIVILATAGASLAGWVCYQHHRWQARIERERFILALKAAATPDQLRPDERDRLQLLRAPWWAVWRWLPEQLG